MVNSMKSVYITDYLERNANKKPNKPAVIFNDQMLTYEELFQKVVTCARYIQNKIHVAPDKKDDNKQYIVALLLPNSIDFLVAYLGVIYAGHIAMPLDPNFKAMEVQNVVSQMNPSLIITNENYKDHFLTSTNTVFVSELDSGESSIDRSSFQCKLQPCYLLQEQLATPKPSRTLTQTICGTRRLYLNCGSGLPKILF